MLLAVFPGQGSQKVGMAREVYEYFPVAKRTFEEADDTLGFSLSNLVFFGTEEELRITTNTQVALFTACIAILRSLECKYEKKVTEFVQMLAGHSMGQYTALCAAESVKFSDGLSLLKIRSKLMDEAPLGSMLACLGIPFETLMQIVEKAKKYGVCCVANYNSSTQTILSGDTRAISFAESEFSELKYKTAMLKVSGAFHSPLMQEAASLFKEFVDKIEFTQPKVPVINNVTGEELKAENVRENLVDQIANSVKWLQGVDYFIKYAEHKNSSCVIETTPTMVEIGPGSVLTNLAKRDKKCLRFANVANVQGIDSFLTLLTSK